MPSPARTRWNTTRLASPRSRSTPRSGSPSRPARGARRARTRHRSWLGAAEVLRMTEPVKQAIHNKECASTVRRLALEEGMVSLRQDAVRKVVAGQTTPEEILRAVYLEE